MSAERAEPRSEASGDRGASARRAALALLDDVLLRNRLLDDGEGARRVTAALSDRDRAFARRLTLTTLRRLGEIDLELDARLDRPLPKALQRARLCLRLMLAELLFLGTPAHAAVAIWVAETKRAAPKLGGLANAVGRGVGREGRRTQPSPAEAARVNTPDWLLRRLASDWGEARALEIAAAQLEAPPLDLTPKDPQETDALAAALGAVRTPTGSLRLGASQLGASRLDASRPAAPGPITALPGYAEGAWWVQDAAAALPARLLNPRPGLRALDLCAAPGGKTLQLAAAGAEVTALDISEPRLARLRDNLSRTGLTADVVAADACAWRPETLFDAVLLDAPCSALGTVRRHPEALRQKREEGLRPLIEAQDRLLDAAWALLRPGGWLVFCTCSTVRSEGEARATAFERRQPDAVTSPIAAEEVGEPAFLSKRGRLRTLPAQWPAIGGVDGFFAARFEKRG